MIEQPRKSDPPPAPSPEKAQPCTPTDRDVKKPASEQTDAEKRIERFRER
jgi:hypothetical protein